MAPPQTAIAWQSQVLAASNYQPLESLVELGSGSDWTSVNALAFRVLLKKAKAGQKAKFLGPYFDNAKDTVKSSPHMKKLCEVLKDQWRDWPRPKLRESGGVFGGFLSRLAEIMQVQAVLTPPERPNLRPRSPIASEPDAFDLSELTSSLVELSSSSSGESSLISSVYADQRIYTAQKKPEAVTNQAIVEFLDTLSLLRPSDKSSALEWGAEPNTLTIPLPGKIGVKSVNDGGLIHRFREPRGKWTIHPTRIVYCAIEVLYEAKETNFHC